LVRNLLVSEQAFLPFAKRSAQDNIITLPFLRPHRILSLFQNLIINAHKRPCSALLTTLVPAQAIYFTMKHRISAPLIDYTHTVLYCTTPWVYGSYIYTSIPQLHHLWRPPAPRIPDRQEPLHFPDASIDSP